MSPARARRSRRSASCRSSRASTRRRAALARTVGKRGREPPCGRVEARLDRQDALRGRDDAGAGRAQADIDRETARAGPAPKGS